MLGVAALLSVLMGITLGLLGGGGSILTVPLLVYVLGVDPKQAIATSLLVVAATSAAASVQHARAGHVQWKTGITFGLFAMMGACFGGFLARYFTGGLLLVLFALLAGITGIAMLRRKAPRDDIPAARMPRLAVWTVAIEGALLGTVTGLVGAGGGFLVVPILVLRGGLGIRSAIGTSLVVIAMNSLAGLAGHLSHLTLDLQIATVVTVFAVLGSLVGAALARYVAPHNLRRAFAWFVLAMAIFMLAKQALPAVLTTLRAIG